MESVSGRTVEVVSESMAVGPATTVESVAGGPFGLLSVAGGPATTVESVASRAAEVVSESMAVHQ